MKVTIEFEGEASERQVRYLIMDALSEFVSHRGPTAETYVNNRYPNTADYSWLNRADKIREVNERIILAQRLHSGNIKVK